MSEWRDMWMEGRDGVRVGGAWVDNDFKRNTAYAVPARDFNGWYAFTARKWHGTSLDMVTLMATWDAIEGTNGTQYKCEATHFDRFEDARAFAKMLAHLDGPRHE